MNFRRFQLQEKIQTLISSHQSKLLLRCIDVIDSAYLSNKDLVEESVDGYDIVGFKGTSSIPDLMIDLKFSQKDDFHSGFKSKADDIRDSWKLEERLKGKSNVILTGHSLGAAIALYYFIYFRTSKDTNLASKIKMLICFGMPRVGSVFFLEDRLEKALAVSPKLDPAKALHFVILKEGGQLDVVTTIPKALHSPKEELMDVVDFYSVKPPSKTSKWLGIHTHRLSAYRESLERLLAGTL